MLTHGKKKFRKCRLHKCCSVSVIIWLQYTEVSIQTLIKSHRDYLQKNPQLNRSNKVLSEQTLRGQIPSINFLVEGV